MASSNWSRRQFIKEITTISSAIAMTPSVFPNILIPKIKDKLGIALVGLGYYSTDVLAPAFKFTKHCELKGIVTGTPSKAENWQKKHNLPAKNIYNYENFDTIANNPEIDVIYIVLPPSMHAEYTIRAAKAGKQVWCEKPMAPSVKECEEMIKACKDNKVSLAIGYRMQHEANTKQMIQWRKAGKFGTIKTVNVGAGYFDGRSDHWKMKKAMGGGAMYDMGVYSLQGARYSVGQEPVAVISASHTTNRPDVFKEVDETTAFKLEFPGGAIADCETSFGKSINFLDVKGSKGWFKLEPFQAYSGVQGNSSVGMLKLPMGNQQATQMDDDAQYIKAKKAMMVPGEEGLRDIRVVEKIYESARTGKRVVI